MKWWKLVLGLAVAGSLALVLAGRKDGLRFRRAHRL